MEAAQRLLKPLAGESWFSRHERQQGWARQVKGTLPPRAFWPQDQAQLCDVRSGPRPRI